MSGRPPPLGLTLEKWAEVQLVTRNAAAAVEAFATSQPDVSREEAVMFLAGQAIREFADIMGQDCTIDMVTICSMIGEIEAGGEPTNDNGAA